MRLALLAQLACLATAFNLEPRVAVVKEGDPGSYFGFSVAQHQILVSSDEMESALLVGAPLQRQGSAVSGSLWKCPFTAKNRDCSIVDALPRSKRRRQHIKEADGQWLGTVVQSQGPGEEQFVFVYLSSLSFMLSAVNISPSPPPRSPFPKMEHRARARFALWREKCCSYPLQMGV